MSASTCLSLHLREMLNLAVSLLRRLRCQRGQQLALSKAITSPLRCSSRPGRCKSVGGPGESSNSVRLQAASRSLAGWRLLRTATICFRLLPALETHKLGPGPCLTPEALIRDVWADDPQETEPD